MYDFVFDKKDLETSRKMVAFLRFAKDTPEDNAIFESQYKPFIDRLIVRFKQHDDNGMKLFYVFMLGVLGNEAKDSSWLKRVKKRMEEFK